MNSPSFPFGMDVALIRQELVGQDEYGNDVWDDTSTTIPNCVWWPKASTETDLMTRDTVEDTFELLIPPDIDVAPTDKFVVGTMTYDVVGLPFNWQFNPFTNSRAGRLVELQRVTG